MTLLEIIRQRYPDAEEGDFTVIQDGTEVKLIDWNVRDNGAFTKRPEESELRAWIDEVEQQQLQAATLEQNLKTMTTLINRGCEGVHMGQLTDEQDHRLLKALLLMHGAFDERGFTRPVDAWRGYEEGTP